MMKHLLNFRSAGRRTPAWRVLPLLVALPLVGGCRTTVVRRSVERRVERRLATILGPAERYRVRIVDTTDAELVTGRARRVEVRARRVYARNDLLIDSLLLTLDDLRYEGGDPDLVSVRRSDLQVEVTDEALNSYLRASQARYHPVVHFGADQVEVTVTYPFLGTPTVIHATGRFVIREGRQLLFDAEKADISFLNQPGFGEKFVEDRVNPLFDLRRIEFPARLESVQLLPGRLRAYGTAAITTPIKN
jgi:hypothetical protein